VVNSSYTQAVLKGDLGRAETMLVAQAHTLDAIFNNLAQRAVRSEYISQLDAFLKVALRAQAQSRATWEAVAAIKNPTVFGYVKQANIAHGPQQVNNTYDSSSEGNGNKQNKVMEKKDGEWVDTGASRPAVSDDPAMAAVEEIDRTNHKRRKS
jgi:Tfp pilus assembly protein PilE